VSQLFLRDFHSYPQGTSGRIRNRAREDIWYGSVFFGVPLVSPPVIFGVPCPLYLVSPHFVSVIFGVPSPAWLAPGWRLAPGWLVLCRSTPLHSQHNNYKLLLCFPDCSPHCPLCTATNSLITNQIFILLMFNQQMLLVVMAWLSK
jgi:hypothetical protein